MFRTLNLGICGSRCGVAATLEDFLKVFDGGLGIVREYKGSWYLVLQDGRTCVLPDEEIARHLLGLCGSVSYGIVTSVEGEWRLTRAPGLTEFQRKAVERVMADEMLAGLLKQAENGT